MTATLHEVSSSNAFNTTLNGNILDSDTTITFTTTSGLVAPGVIVIDRVNSVGTSTPTVREYISFTGISSNQITGCTRGLGGSTAQAHSSGAVVEETIGTTHWSDLIDFLQVAHDADGNIDTIGANVGLTTPKITTSINDSNGNEIIKTPATASAVNEITVTNAASGGYPIISATGDDATINLGIRPKGTVTSAYNVLQDSNGNEVLQTIGVASAVNEITAQNAATNTAPQLAPTGGDSNIDLKLVGKGTGMVEIDASYGVITTDSDGATVTFNMATSNTHTVTLGGNRTLAVSNVKVGQVFIIRLVQDGTGSRTVTWFTTIKWTGGTTPTLTTTLNKADTFGFLCTSAGNYDGYVIGQNL